MAIRLPLQSVVKDTVTNVYTGPSSVAGGRAITFTLPQDTDNVVVKFTASTVGGGTSATFQTTDDGGVTWYDVARTSVVSNANGTTAQWISAPVIGAGVATGVNQANSILSVGIGSAAASTLGSQQNSGLPILSQYNRVFVRYGAVTSILSEQVTVYTNSQTAQ